MPHDPAECGSSVPPDRTARGPAPPPPMRLRDRHATPRARPPPRAAPAGTSGTGSSRPSANGRSPGDVQRRPGRPWFVSIRARTTCSHAAAGPSGSRSRPSSARAARFGPAAEVEQRLRGMPGEDAAVGAGHAELPQPFEARRCGFEDASDRPRRSSSAARFVWPSAIPSTPPSCSAMSRPRWNRARPSSTRPPAAVTQPRIPSASAASPAPSSVAWATASASRAGSTAPSASPVTRRSPARCASARARGRDGGDSGISRSASATAAAAASTSPASHRYQRIRS